MIFQVRRKTIRIEYATIEADSHHQAADLLRAGMWDDMTFCTSSREAITYRVNGVYVDGPDRVGIRLLEPAEPKNPESESEEDLPCRF